MIKRIKIKGYKSIKEMEMDLLPINIFIGANGSGKSNFLSFFEMLKQIYNQNLREYVALKGIDTFLHKGDKMTTEIAAHLSFEGTNAYFFQLKKGDAGFIFTSDGIWESGTKWVQGEGTPDVYYQDFATYGSESNLRYKVGSRVEYVKAQIEKLQKYHFHDTGEQSPFNKESNIDNDTFYLYEKGNNLSAFLYKMKQTAPISYQLIVKTIQSIAPYFLDFFLVPEPNGNLRLRWKSKYADTVYGANDLSDGTIRFIALAVLFLQPTLPNTLIIDEPELGLHPTAIAKLSGLIQSAAAKGCQVMIATQSTDLISYFKPEDIITVDQIKGESYFRRLHSEDLAIWLEEYAIDDLWKRNIINTGQPNFQ